MRNRGLAAGVLTAVALAVFLYGHFWLRGARFYHDDYTVWLPKAANERPLSAAARLLTRPLNDWGFQHRPVEVFLTRLLWLKSGIRAGLCFLVKTAFWAGLVALMGWLAAAATGRLVPALALCLTLAASSSLFASMLLYGDFLVVAHFFLAAATAFLLYDLHFSDRWKRAPRMGLQAGVFLCYLLALNSKGSARIFLPALGCFVLARGWSEGLRRYGILLGAMLVASIPWGLLPRDPLPPFFPGAPGSGPEQWQPWSPFEWGEMLFGGLRGVGAPIQEMEGPPASVLGAYLPWLTLAALLLAVNAGLAILGTRSGDSMEQPSPVQPAERTLARLWGFWALWALIALGCVPDADRFDRTRYLAELAVPMNGLAILAFHRLCRPFGRVRFQAAALAAVTLIYVLPNLHFTAVLRGTVGVARVAINQIQTYVHQDIKFGTVLFVDFPDDPRSFHPRSATNSFQRINRDSLHDPASLPDGQEAYVVTQLDLSKDDRYMLRYEASGNSYTPYDRLFGTGKRTGKGDRYFVYQIDPALRSEKGADAAP